MSDQLINNVFFRKNSDGVLLDCLDKDETETILKESHSGRAIILEDKLLYIKY